MTPHLTGSGSHDSCSSFDTATNNNSNQTMTTTTSKPCRTSKSDPLLSVHDDDNDHAATSASSTGGRRKSITFDERVSVHEFDRDSHASISSLASCVQQTSLREKQPLTKSLSDPAHIKFMTYCGGLPVEIMRPVNDYPSSPQSVRQHVDMRQLPLEQYNNNETSQIMHETDGGVDYKVQRALEREIRRVLLVDPHDIFLKLLSKALRQALPHITIVTAHSSQEALECYVKQGAANTFDIILSEERLSLFHRHDFSSSGSALLQHFHRIQRAQCSKPTTSLLQPKKSLLIGISAHYNKDRERMEATGAIDFCWAKAPTPNLQTPGLLEALLKAILIKRERRVVLEQVFGGAPVEVTVAPTEQ